MRAAQFDEDPWVRLNAALAVETWDAKGATEAFVAILTTTGNTVRRPMTMDRALSVSGEIGRAAALCLFNSDRRGGAPSPPLTPRAVRTPSVTVPSSELDAAEAVFSLAMNGGLDHAYTLAGTRFSQAVAAFEAVGAAAAARVLREALEVIGLGEDVPEDAAAREAALRDLPADAQAGLAELGHQFSEMDDLMERLESATDG